jgi:hypothetical protein
MIEKRKIEVLEIPEDVLSTALNSPSVNNQKKAYPSINAWALSQKNIIEHYDRYKMVANDNTKFFIRSVSTNNTSNIVQALEDKNSHCILAPIYFDSPNQNYVDDYNKILNKYPHWSNKLILVHIDDIEYDARIKHRENPSPKVKGSIYEIVQDKIAELDKI